MSEDSRLVKLAAANIFDSNTDHAEHMIRSMEAAGLVVIDPDSIDLDELARVVCRESGWVLDAENINYSRVIATNVLTILVPDGSSAE